MINQCRFICFLLVIFLLEGSNSLIAQEALGKINCICIDAGHGGKDPGAISGKLREKDITLAIALKLGKMVKRFECRIHENKRCRRRFERTGTDCK